MMPDKRPTGDLPPRPYSISLQQAAAAIFGVALVDGEAREKRSRPKGSQQQS